MKGRIAALLIIAVMLLPVAGLMYASDEAEAVPGPIDFTGIIEYNGKLMTGAEVYLVWIYDINSEPLIGRATTGPDGSFTISIEGTYDDTADNPVTLTCMTDDVVCKSAVINTKSLIVGKNVDLGTINDFPRGYTEKAEITVLGTVKYGGTAIEGARVTLVNRITEEIITYKNTDNKGAFELKCGPGDYYVTVERGGFFDWESTTLNLGDTNSFVFDDDIYLTITPEDTYWGLDLPHLFSLIGLFIALILLISVVTYVMWIRKHPGKIRIVDDDPNDE